MSKIPNKRIGEYIVPGWLPSWMYTQIEIGNDLERVLEENEQLRADLTKANDIDKELREILSAVIDWVDGPALARVCSIADAHGMGITEGESRDGHAAVARGRALLKGNDDER